MQTLATLRKNPLFYFYAALVLACVLIVVVFAFYRAGYRFDPRRLITHVGTLELETFQTGSDVYIDGKLQEKTAADEETYYFKNLMPGDHSVVVSKQGFWPWQKTVTIQPNGTSLLSSFSVPNGLSGQQIDKSQDEYFAASSLIDGQTPPDENHPKVSSDGGVSIWVEKLPDGREAIEAKYIGTGTVPDYFCDSSATGTACSGEKEVISVKEPIEDADFFEDRSDVILFSAGRGIYAIEIAKQGTQNFEPLYQGQAPRFFKKDIYSIYLKDGSELFDISL